MQWNKDTIVFLTLIFVVVLIIAIGCILLIGPNVPQHFSSLS